ncbi:MAG: type II toxin-antitoxin system VapC family toxin [Cyanophyceae cyanobacterium]
MRLLLDTHALLWFVLEDPRLSIASQSVITNPNNQILVSIASLWEIAIKISIGKYQLSDPFESFWLEQLKLNRFTLLNVAIQHTARIITLPFHHRDPFDRLIIAQALVERIPIVSVDDVFDLYGVSRVW